MNTTVKIILFFVGTFIATVVFIVVLLQFSKTLGMRARNDTENRWNQNVKPSLGGIAIFLSVFISIITYLISQPHENVFGSSSFVFFFIGMCLAFFMGLTDDAFDTKPLLKLTTQILCGVCVVLSKSVIPVSEIDALNAAITIIWIVGVMNSLNMLDNMDGITASVSGAAFLNFLIISLWFCCDLLDIYVFIIIGFMGSILGFLAFNKPPSKLFMGDSGSQLIGYAVAYFSVYILWNFKGIQEIPFWLSTLILLLILALPFIDTFTVVFNRIARGVSPAHGGKDHTTHHMVYAGFNEGQVWITYTLLALFLGSLGFVMLYLHGLGWNAWTLLLLIPFFVVFYLLFRLTHVVKSSQKKPNSPNHS